MIRFIKIIMLILAFLASNVSYSSAADTVSIVSSQAVIGSVETVPNIWKGNVPTKIGYPAGTYSQKLEFPIQGLLPHTTLADRATGVEVEFEVWSQAGKKIAYDTVYSFDWNPVGPNTLVSMYLNESDAIGNHTMLIRTIYELSTTGLLTRYLKSEVRLPLQIAAYSKPGNITSMTTNWGAEAIQYSFTLADSKSSQDYYEFGFQYLLNSSADKSKYANYSQVYVVKKITGSSFQIPYEEIVNWVKEKNLDVEKTIIMVRVRGVNTWGVGEWGAGLYTETTIFNRYYQNIITARNKAEAEAKAKAEAEAKAKAEAELKAKLPLQVQGFSGNFTSTSVSYTFDTTIQTNLVEYYEIGISYLNYPDGNLTIDSNYSFPTVLKKTSEPRFSISKDEIGNFLKTESQDLTKSTVLVRVRGVNSFGVGEWSSGVYTESVKLFPPTLRKTTIVCTKGKLTKKVTSVNPRCPSGYKKK